MPASEATPLQHAALAASRHPLATDAHWQALAHGAASVARAQREGAE